MKILLSWLNEYVQIDDIQPEHLAETLINIGLEVEKILYLGQGLNRIKTCRVTDIQTHPSSDKLKICRLDLGNPGPGVSSDIQDGEIQTTYSIHKNQDNNLCPEKTLTVVTGAPNVKKGMMAAVALEGASLPCGKDVSCAEFRGIMSFGMLCSGEELGIDDDVIEGAGIDGILPLPPGTVPGADIAGILGLDDYVFDVAVTANRPDCQSLYGIAREVSVAFKRKLKPLDLKYSAVPYKNEYVPEVKIENKELCPEYLGSYIKDVKIEPSPLWMRRRLRAAGLRSVNNAVDITNYVLIETGQPLHAFDIRNIEKSIIVRTAKNGEKITALDSKEYVLPPKTLVIADNSKPLAIAGIMGGESSGVKVDTSEIFLETARFARASVRASSRALGLQSDSSKRFEKGIDALSADTGRRRALALFGKLKAGNVIDISKGNVVNDVSNDSLKIVKFDINGKKDDIFKKNQISHLCPHVISTSVNQINAVLGIDIPTNFIISTLKSLQFKVVAQKAEITPKNATKITKKNREHGPVVDTVLHDTVLNVTVPLFRDDVDNFTDLAEEVIRFYGYHKLDESPVTSLPMTKGGISHERFCLEKISRICTAFGAFETKSFSFTDPGFADILNLSVSDSLRQCIRIMNPISEEYSLMRTQLAYSVLQTAALNLSRQNSKFRIFEIDNVFISKSVPPKTLPDERKTLCAAFVGPDEDFYAVKSLAVAILDAFDTGFTIKRSQKPYLHPGISADIEITTNAYVNFETLINGINRTDVNGAGTDAQNPASSQVIGSCGKIHPITARSLGITEANTFVLEIDIQPLMSKIMKTSIFEPLPKFPAVERDLSIVVPESVFAADLIDFIKACSNLVKDVGVFDVYRGNQIGEGQKSMSFNIILQSREKTLTEGEIAGAMNNIIKGLEGRRIMLRA